MEGERLFNINEKVKCVKCGNIGAVQFYGTWYPRGTGEKADMSEYLKRYKDTPRMSYAIGFGGTIPHRCMNCGNEGLIDFGGLEGYPKAFETIKEVVLPGGETMIVYLVIESNDNGWHKPLKAFKDKKKALDYAESKQRWSNDINLNLDYSYTVIGLID